LLSVQKKNKLFLTEHTFCSSSVENVKEEEFYFNRT